VQGIFTAFVVAVLVASAQPATAVTFPSLTLYVGAGITDSGGPTDNEGLATVFNCSNVSGVSATVRFLTLFGNGNVNKSVIITIPHGGMRAVGTHRTSTYVEDVNLETGAITHGSVNIEATQSAVFCNAVLLDAADAGDGFVLPLVRVNPHPGTVE
jgi:hypothetical protein